MNRRMRVKRQSDEPSNACQMELGMEWTHIVGTIYSIP
jgi:hypothetical protein